MAILKYKNENGQWEAAETPGAIKYTEQTLTEEQKAQARANLNVDNLFTNALKATALGETISVSDASPIEHELSVKLENKNLFTTDNYTSHYSTTNRNFETNSFSFTSNTDAKGQCLVAFQFYLEAGTYYLSGDDIVTSNNTFKGGYAVLKGDTFIVNHASSTTIDSTFNIAESGTYTINFYGDYAADKGTVYTYSNIKLCASLELNGITVSKLVDGVEVQSATASADGTVEGLVSSPAFELTSSTKDGSVLINLEYNRDINVISFGNGIGKDGFSPIAKVEETESGAVITITDKNGTTTATVANGKDGEDGYTPVKNVDYFDGKDGYTPQKNVDYFDGKDGADGTTQLVPLFANSIAECTDTTKLYVLPDGYIWAYMKTQVWQEGTKGLVPFSTVSGGGSIFNEKGYILNKRLNSSATEKDSNGSIVTGFIPVTKNSVLRIKNFSNGSHSFFVASGNHICLYNSSYTLLTTSQQGYGSVLKNNSIGVMDETTGIYTVTVSDIYNDDTIAFVRVSSMVADSASTVVTDEDASKLIVTVDEEIIDGYYVDSYAWASTGHAFVPADYEDRIIVLEKETEDHEERLKSVEALIETNEDNSDIPEYWLEELEAKADEIQSAMEKAGKNKSAFLWYTDAHWVNGNSKISPKLLNYLYMNTPMNKVNFGGDIIGNSLLATREEMKYLYEWRKAIKDLPNHHSVLGNHDIFSSDSVDYEDDNYRYTFMLAPEENSDMVMGDGNYYYIDNPCEKTRYLYLTYPNSVHADMLTQGQFIVDAISNVAEGWHIVAIAHRWWQYSSSATPTVGSVPAYETEILSVFDAYNARTTRTGSNYFYAQDFTNAKGKVEFCIGGHVHIDLNLSSTGGIPVIITASDVNQERSSDETEDSGTIGTITESAVFGIIADYNNHKITVVGVGRGGSREITY